MEVHTFLDAIRDTFLGVRKPPVRAGNVRGKQFSSTDDPHDGYVKKQVAAFLDAAGQAGRDGVHGQARTTTG
jgi:hypothetical protein